MALVAGKRSLPGPVPIEDSEIIIDVYGAGIKKPVVIRAEAKNVAWDVWSVVWLTKSLDVGTIGDRTARAGELDIAHLAGVIVYSFY